MLHWPNFFSGLQVFFWNFCHRSSGTLDQPFVARPNAASLSREPQAAKPCHTMQRNKNSFRKVEIEQNPKASLMWICFTVYCPLICNELFYLCVHQVSPFFFHITHRGGVNPQRLPAQSSGKRTGAANGRGHCAWAIYYIYIYIIWFTVL